MGLQILQIAVIVICAVVIVRQIVSLVAIHKSREDKNIQRARTQRAWAKILAGIGGLIIITLEILRVRGSDLLISSCAIVAILACYITLTIRARNATGRP